MVRHLLRCSASSFLTTNLYKMLNCPCVFISSKLKSPSTVNPEEVKKFNAKSSEWWNSKTYDGLRLFNSVRVPLIRDGILSSTMSKNRNISKPLSGYSILDVGCGGGILSEPLASLGAKVTGLDPGADNVKVANEHASKDADIKKNLIYMCDTAENLAASDSRFDAVVASEVVEHVNNVPTFVRSCVELTKINGSLFFTTINRTIASYFMSILIAENVINLIPKGTHDWNKFVKPSELIELLESLNCKIVSNEGIMYNPLTKKFSWSKSTLNYYSLHAVKV